MIAARTKARPGFTPQIGTNIVTARSTIGQTKLQIGKPIFCAVHERFFRKAPCESTCGKVSPTIIRRKLRRAIGTERTGEQITVHESVTQTSEKGNRTGRHAIRIGCRERGGCRMDQSHRGVIIKCRRIATARDLRRFGVRLQDFITQQCREYIVLADIEVIIQSAHRTQSISHAPVKGGTLISVCISVLIISTLR